MNHLKFYKLAIGGLVLLNIGVLTFFLLAKTSARPPHPPRNNNFQEEVPSILDLNDEQRATFYDLADQHEQQIRTINNEQQKLLHPYFESIADSSIDLDTTFVLNQFQQLERRKLATTRQHFLKIKGLLNEDQLPRFEIVMEKALGRIISGKKKHRPPPKDFR